MAYKIKDNETTLPAMIYADQRIIWGKLVAPEAVRAQTWLKMSLLPDYFTLLEARMLVFAGDKPILFELDEIHVPIPSVLAYHLLPPFDYEPDYNPDDTVNRRLRGLPLRREKARVHACRFSHRPAGRA
jgi:hypothetical protein